MIRKFLTHFYFEDYVPHVRHIIYPCLMIAVGYKAIISYHWDGFGLIFITIGCLLAFVIMFGIAWRGPIEYWDKINSALDKMSRIKDPAVWAALGFKHVPQVTQIKETSYDEAGQFTKIKFKTVPTPPAYINQVANKVLMSKSVEFTQELYGHLVPNWRKFHGYMKKNGYIVPKNPKNVRNGYRLNRKGADLMYEYADEMVKMTLKKENNAK